MRRSVVITGLGAVSGMGVGAAPLWDGLCSGRSCLGPVTRFDATGFESRLAAEVKDYSAKDFVPKHYRKAVKLMARDIELAVGAAKEAFEDAGMVTRATLGEDAAEDLRDVARLARALDDNLAGARVMLAAMTVHDAKKNGGA